MEDTSQVIIDDDEPTADQLQLAFERAKDEFGGYVADYESDEFKNEFNKQLNIILTDEAIEGLIQKGIMVREAMDGGEIGYRLTPYGEALREAATT